MTSGPARVGAFFDVDGTLSRSDIFRDLVAFRRSRGADAAFTATLPLRGVLLLALDRLSRTAVNRLTYRWYRGYRRADLAAWAEAFQRDAGRRRLMPRPVELLARHARLGHRIVLVTGAVDAIVAPLPRLLAEVTGEPLCERARVEAVTLVERDGAFTGEIDGAPLGGDEKARRVRAVAAEEGLDLRASFAYGDSIADLPMLLCAGRPAAVRPDGRLRAFARRRGWPIIDSCDTIGGRA